MLANCCVSYFFQKQCQIAVLPLGTGNDLARVLGWGSACDDDAHLPQLLDRYEKASTKMLDRWSIMVFERGISLRRGMSISHSPDAILSQFEDNAMWHLQVSLQFALTSISLVIQRRNVRYIHRHHLIHLNPYHSHSFQTVNYRYGRLSSRHSIRSHSLRDC